MYGGGASNGPAYPIVRRWRLRGPGSMSLSRRRIALQWAVTVALTILLVVVVAVAFSAPPR